jgi:serine O-acetyltransferase
MDAMSFYRVAHALGRRGFGTTATVISRVARILFSAHIPPEARIGTGTHLGYGGLGIIVHRDAVIGRDVLLCPGVVIGGRSELSGVPIIEDGVKIGVGAKVLGPIRIGAGAKIGANAVVLHDVAAGETVAGIPAVPIRRRQKFSVA